MYIYEQPGWPQFTWDSEAISEFLIPLRHEQGRLVGAMQSVGFSFQEAVVLETLTEDVVKTSAIEGEVLDPELVRSSIARHLGIEVAAAHKSDHNVEGIVAMLLDATQNFQEPLTPERLFHPIDGKET